MNVSDLIDPSFSYRLIATLMHFLWQGCLVALLAVVGDGLLSRASACRRYALHVAALAIMVACVAITFSQIEFPGSASTVTVETMAMTTVTEPIAPGRVDGDSVSMPSTATPAFVGVEPSLSESHPVVAVEAVESPIVLPERSVGDRDHWHPLSARAGYTWAPQIALLYFACCGLLLARLIRGTWVAHRLRRMSTTVSDDSLIATLQRQSTELGLRVLPRIAWCAEVSIPLVIGVLKPMILLPAAAATGLSPDQLQALITHELAHIRRYDLLVNLVQRVVESMLFFHPAVWFISRRISNEREQACDELVLSTGCERLRYADALVRMAELSSSLRRLGTSAPATSLAASGANSSEFKRRVLKVLSVPTASQLRPSRIALLAIVALILGVTISASRLRLSAFAETQPQNAEDSAGRGSPDPALDPTAGLPDSDKESNSTDNANGDLRSSPAAGSGDPRRARDLRRAQEIEAIGQPKPMWCQPIKAPANAWPSEVGPLVVDERRVIIGEHVLDLRTGESLGRLTFGDFSLDFLRLSANRRYLLACGTHPKSFEGNFTFPSTLAEVWDLTTLKRVGSAFQVPHSIYDGHADVSPDGKVVVSGSREDVVLFDVATGKEINKLDVKSRRIDAVGFSPDGRWLVVSNQNDLTYWKWRTTEKPQTLHVGRTIISLAFSPDSRYLAEGPDCQVDIEIRDLQTLKVAHALRDEFGSPLYVKTMCFSSDGKRFIASNDVGVDETKLLIPHRLLAWELPTGRLKAQGSRPSQYGWGMGATPGGFYAVRANESNGLMAPTWVLADNTAGADTPTAITPKPDVEWGPAVNGLKARAVPVLSSMSEDAIDPAQRVTMFERPEDVAFVVELENVSDKPIKLLNTRNGNGVDNAKGKANSDWFGQFLFSVDLFDENGKLIEQPDVKVVDLDLALVGHQVATVEPGKLHRFLLRPARWSSPFKLPLDAGRFRAAVRYHGLSDRVTKRMKDYRPDSPQLTAISGDITAPATTFAVRTFNGRSKRSVVKRETDPPRDGNDGSQAVPFDELVWGQPVNGLRAAMSFLPLQETHAHGEKPAVILHLQNVGTQPLTLLSKLSLPNAIATIKNDKGEPINLDAAELLGERLNGLISLKPQQIVVLDAGSLGLAVTQERANAFDARTPRRLIAPAGKYSVQLEATFNNILHWERGQDKVLAKDAWVGTLQTGAAPLTIVTAPPDGLGFLKPYPKLHGLSLDMTEPQFLEIVKQQELKTRKTVEGEKVTHHIALGDDHTLIVMFDKDAKCSGIQRVRGEDDALTRPEAKIGKEKTRTVAKDQIEFPIQVVTNDGRPVVGAKVQLWAYRTSSGSPLVDSQWSPETTTDAAGTARVVILKELFKIMALVETPRKNGIPKILGLNLRVEHPQYPTWSQSVEVANPIRVVLAEPATIEVRAHRENDAELLREVMPVFSSYAGSSSEWLAMKEQSQKEGVLTIRRVDLTSKQAARWLRLVHVPKEGPAWFSELIDLKPLQPPISLNVAMQPGVRVAGRLPDTVPRPVVNGRVAAQVVSGGSDASRNWSWSMGTTITKDGSFVLDSVPANENLQLIAVCDGWVSRSPTVDEMADYARTHSFETKYSGASAESVHPRLFRTIAPGIEPLLPMEATTDCEVTVVDESGQPIADALVAFSPNQHWFHGGSIGLGMSHDSLKSLQTVFQTGSPLKSDMTNERFNATTDARGKAVIANLPAANTDPASPAMHLLRVLHANYDAPIEPRFYGQRIQLVELHPGQSGRVTVRMTPAKRNFAKETGQANPKLQSGLEFLKPYPKLHGLSLDMTEPQFLEIVKQQQQLKSHKTVEGEKVTHYIGLGDGHTLIVMFDKDAKCSGIRRVHGADQLGKDDDDKTPIVEIVIEGNDTIDSAEIRKRIEQPIGEPASDSQIRKDVRAVFGTRWFYSVMPVYRRTEGGLVLVFIVVERPKSERVAVSSPSNIERDHQKVVDALDEVGSIEFANVRLHKVLDVFRRYWPNVAIQVDPLAEAAMQTQVSFQTKGDEFEYVLAAALDQAKLSYCVHSVWLVVGTADEIRGRGYAVPESFSELITKLKQVDDGIRWERILRGTVEAADLAALPKVLKLLEHTQPVVQREALRVLLRFGDRAGSAQSATLKLTDSKDRSVRRVAWRAFAATGLNDPQTLPRIVQAWNAGHQEVRHDLWDLVALFGNDDAPMRIVFEHGTPELRQHLMRSIGDPDEYQHGLVMLGLNDGQPATRAAALQHGLQRARYSEPLVRQLKRMQQDADPLCRVLAAGHLLKLADSYSAALALLIAEGSKDNAPEEVRTVALSAFEWLSLEIGQKVSQSLEEARRTATSEKATEFCRQAMSIIARRKMQIENSRAGDSPKDIGADDKALRGQIRWVDQATGSAWINLGEADSVTKRMIFKVREKGTVELTRIVDGNTSVVRIVRDDLANPIAKGDEIVFLELAPAAGSGNPRRAPLDRIVSLKASDRPQELADVLKEVCRQAEVEFEIDDAELQKDRSLHAMPMIVDEEAVRGPLGFVLSQVLNPVLAFELVDQKLRVSTRQKLKGNRFEADHIDLAKLAESAGPTLTSLRLCGTRATDDDLRHLAKFPKLERLDLTSTAISDAGMEHVARLESLTTLRLGDFVTDAGLKTLTASRSIRTLALLGSPVTDAAAESLVQMSALETLTIQWANFGDAGAKRLAAADRLKHLVLYVRTLTDEGAGALATCQKLERLSLLGARLTVGSLKALEKMRSLRDLEIGFPNISESDVKPLRTALAKTRIRQTRIAPPDPRSADGHVFDAETGRILEMFRSQFGHPDPVTGEIEWEPLREHYLAPNVTGRFGVSSLQPFRKFRVIADGYEPVEITALLLPGDDPRNHEMKIQMRRAKKKVAETKPPDGLEFLKPYPKLHGLSLDMTEPQFLEIVKQQELKTRKTVEGEKVTHHIALGDGHTLIVMFDKDAKCGGIQRVLGGQ